MISIKNLSKSFGGSIILDNVSLDIPNGSTTVIIGASGCGKSTLLRCINRLEIPDSGSVEIDGKNIHEQGADVDGIRRGLGMVYQSFNLFSHLNVMENMIVSPMKVLGIPKTQAIKQAEELLTLVGMENRRYHMPNQLSGGQKQRVAIARALAMKPKVMLFDEPTSALDPTMVDEVENVIRRLVGSGMTSVIVTHEMRFAKNIASDVIFLAEHGIYERGEPKKLFETPTKELTRQFLYRARMLEKTITKSDADIYALCSEIRSFASAYGFSQRQARGVEYVCDELILPALRNSANDKEEITVRFVADENGESATMLVEFKQADADPISKMDELSIKLLSGFTKELGSVRNENGIWEVSAKV